MLSKARSAPVAPRAPRTLAAANTDPALAGNGPSVTAGPDVAPVGGVSS